MLSSGITDNKISEPSFTGRGRYLQILLFPSFPRHRESLQQEAKPREEVFLALLQKEKGFPLFPAHLSD